MTIFYIIPSYGMLASSPVTAPLLLSVALQTKPHIPYTEPPLPSCSCRNRDPEQEAVYAYMPACVENNTPEIQTLVCQMTVAKGNLNLDFLRKL